jgi:hypothetical protein
MVKKINVFGMFSKLNIVKIFWPKKIYHLTFWYIYLKKKKKLNLC